MADFFFLTGYRLRLSGQVGSSAVESLQGWGGEP
jgi:hypothetical protein